MERYERKFSEQRDSVLVADCSKNEFANKYGRKYLSTLSPRDIVWLQDKSAKYHGFYLVTPKKQFKSLGTMPGQSIFKKYGVDQNDVEILYIYKNTNKKE